MLFTRFVDQYCTDHGVAESTASFYRCTASVYQRWHRNPLSTVNAALRVGDFFAYLSRRDGCGRSRQAGIRRSLKALFRAAYNQGLLEEIPTIPVVKVPQHQPDGFTEAELTALIKFADPWQKASIMLAYDTGCRKGDLFALKWSHVGDDKLVRFVASKTGRHKPASVSDYTLELCRALKPHYEKAKMRMWPRKPPRELAEHLIPYPFGKATWKKAWTKLGERAGVDTKDRALQCIRRTGASRIARERGVYEASLYLGHKGIDTALRFYMVPHIVDEKPPMPPAILGPSEPARMK